MLEKSEINAVLNKKLRFSNNLNELNKGKQKIILKDEIKELIIDWLSFTSIHGLSRLLHAKHMIVKIMGAYFYYLV